jgi:peroxiredoxin
MSLSSFFYVSYGALWVLLIFQSLVLVGLVRAVGSTTRAQVGPPSPATRLLNTEAPTFTALDVFGQPAGSAEFAGRLTALLFVSKSCPACTLTLTEMSALKAKADDSVVVICQSSREDCLDLIQEHELDVAVVADADLEIGRLFEIVAVPTAVLIGADGRIRSYGHPERDGVADEVTAEEVAEAH